jgi:hypothetical protein
MSDLNVPGAALLLLLCGAWVGCTLAVIFWIKCRKYRDEVARLVGTVAGFTLSDLKENPAAIVQHLRSDANVCDMAGQKDMADRLRGYATLFERWFDDSERSDTLRRIANGG